MPDESLSGLVARASGANVYERTSDMLAFAGLGRKKPESIAFAEPDVVPRLEHLMGLSPNTLSRHMHSPLAGGRVDFFGVPLRDIFIERIARRVSPAALRSSPYARAIWQIRTFGFDPATLDPLVATCPQCKRGLGFKLTQGIAFCDHCRTPTEMGFDMPSVDLRKIEQEPYVVDDRPALDFVTGLLDPAIVEFDKSVLPAELSNVSRGDMFEIVHTIAAAIKMNSEGKLPGKLFSRSAVGAIHPNYLAAAGRAVLSFPEGYAALLRDAARDAASRPGEWGNLKAFGALAMVHRDQHVDIVFRKRASNILDETLASDFDALGVGAKGDRRPADYVPLKHLKRILNNHGALSRLAAEPLVPRLSIGTSPKAPILLLKSRAQMHAVEFKDSIPEIGVALALSMPPDAVRNLATTRLVDAYGLVTSSMSTTGDRLMSKRLLDRLLARLTADHVPKKAPANFVTFNEAMLMFPVGCRPWVPLLQMMLDGRVEYCFHKRPAKGLLRAVSVAGVAMIRDELMREQLSFRPHGIERVTAGSAALILGISFYPAFQELIGAKQFIAEEGTFSYADVLDFGRKHILANEAGVRGQRSTANVRKWMEAHDIEPTFDFPVKCGLIYPRDRVEPLLQMAGPTEELLSTFRKPKLRLPIRRLAYRVMR